MDRRLIASAVAAALAEDLGRGGDITSEAIFGPSDLVKARIEARQAGVVAGIELVVETFRQVDPAIRVELLVRDAERVAAMQPLARLHGPTVGILSGERTALNFLGHLSGVATATHALAEAVQGTRATIVDTRKTTPGLRALEKYAVRCGGGKNHRLGLDDAVLIKDNHLAAAGSVTRAIQMARSRAGHLVKVEVEVATLEQFDEALQAQADAVLLDNMSPEIMREAVARRDRSQYRPILEASGGVTLANVRGIAETGVDLVSVGWVTHSAPNLDVAMEVES